MYTRTLDNQLPENSFFLFGPRQAGKSTLLKKEKADLTIDLLDPELQLAYNKSPNLLRQQVEEIKSFHEINPKVPCFIVALVIQPLKLSFVRALPPIKLFNALSL